MSAHGSSARVRGSGAPPALRLGLDVGGTKLLGVVVGDDGEVRRRVRRPTGAGIRPQDLVGMIREIHAEIEGEGLRVAAVGVGFPGLVDGARGRVRSSVMLQGWRDVPLAERISDALGLPCAVDNDVNAAALAELEARREDPRAAHSMVFVAVGTGIGGAITLGGALWTGADGFAGEIGNLVLDPHGPPWRGGAPGTVNSLAAGSALEERLGLGPGQLEARVAKGDPQTLAAVDAGARALGRGLALLAGVLNPALIVVGGGLAQLGSRYLDHVRLGLAAAAFAECAQSCAVEGAIAGYEAGALGAAALTKALTPGASP